MLNSDSHDAQRGFGSESVHALLRQTISVLHPTLVETPQQYSARFSAGAVGGQGQRRKRGQAKYAAWREDAAIAPTWWQGRTRNHWHDAIGLSERSGMI